MDSNLSKGAKGTVLKQVIGQRYVEGVRQSLKQLKVQFTERSSSLNSQGSQNTLFEIHLSQQITSKQSQFYYNVLKKFYEVRKILNPQLTFEGFLSHYNKDLNEKIQKYRFQSLIDQQVQSFNLNSSIVSTQLALMKSETIELILGKKEEMQTLQSQSEKVNNEYERLVTELITKNAQLNVENIEYQLRLKEHEISKRQKATKIYLPSSSIKSKPTTKLEASHQQNHQSVNDEKKQQVERIKVVVNNNMWGWGDKIQERLNKLKSLQQELHQD